MSLEDDFFRDFEAGKKIDLERGLLIAVGLETEKDIYIYQKRLDQLSQKFANYLDDLTGNKNLNYNFKHQDLFNFLWSNKKNRYKDDQVLLNKAIDLQLYPDKLKRVGNCLALTSLYNVLAIRENLEVKIMHNPGHVFSIIHEKGEDVYLENTYVKGFNVQLDSIRTKAIKAENESLISMVYHNKGLNLSNTNILDSVDYYIKSLKLFPNYFNAYNSLGNLLYSQNKYDTALHLYRMALKSFENASYYTNIGSCYKKKGNIIHAMMNYNKALELDPDNLNIQLKIANIKKSQKLYKDYLEIYVHIQKETRKEVMKKYDNAMKYFAENDIESVEQEYNRIYDLLGNKEIIIDRDFVLDMMKKFDDIKIKK